MAQGVKKRCITIFKDSYTYPATSTVIGGYGYRVKGDGIVIAFGSTYSNANTYGTYAVEVQYMASGETTPTIIMNDTLRYNSNNSSIFGANAAAPISVTDGDTVRFYVTNTKTTSGVSGNVYCNFRIVCIGCTVEKIS